LPLDSAQYGNISSNNHQKRSHNLNTNTRKILPAYTQIEKPKKHPEKPGQNHYNFQFSLNKLTQAQYVNALQTEQSDAPIQFYGANYLYLMKIALIKENSRKENTNKEQHHFNT
jgi:hypothetical protein